MNTIYVLVVILQGVTQPPQQFENLGQCRLVAHRQVGDTRPFDPETALFFSPDVKAKAYCRQVRS